MTGEKAVAVPPRPWAPSVQIANSWPKPVSFFQHKPIGRLVFSDEDTDDATSGRGVARIGVAAIGLAYQDGSRDQDTIADDEQDRRRRQ